MRPAGLDPPGDPSQQKKLGEKLPMNEQNKNEHNKNKNNKEEKWL
jgi:hypothetical protein